MTAGEWESGFTTSARKAYYGLAIAHGAKFCGPNVEHVTFTEQDFYRLMELVMPFPRQAKEPKPPKPPAKPKPHLEKIAHEVAAARGQLVLTMRVADKMTLTAIAAKFGVTPPRARQIALKAEERNRLMVVASPLLVDYLRGIAT